MIDGSFMVHYASLIEYCVGRNDRARQDLTCSANFRCCVDRSSGINQRLGSQPRVDHPGENFNPIATTVSSDRYQRTDVPDIWTLGNPLLKPGYTDVQWNSR
jgi:hypothetical protein